MARQLGFRQALLWDVTSLRNASYAGTQLLDLTAGVVVLVLRHGFQIGDVSSILSVPARPWNPGGRRCRWSRSSALPPWIRGVRRLSPVRGKAHRRANRSGPNF